jgi:hypothetical protein
MLIRSDGDCDLACFRYPPPLHSARDLNIVGAFYHYIICLSISVFMLQLYPKWALVTSILCFRGVFPFDPVFTISSRNVHASSPLRLSAEKETLNFIANIETASTPLDSVSTDVLAEFLKTTVCRNHFLSAGGTSKCVEIDWTTELEDLWRGTCARFCLDTLPCEGDAIVVGETCLQFPGLKLVNNVYTGVKLVEGDNLPSYSFLLIGERRQVYGPPPLVWLFNQMTGNSAEEDNVVKPSNTRVLSILSISDASNSPCFTFVCNAEVIVEFPKFLLKILPASKEKIEEQGTASIKKAIERDISKAVNTVNDAFFEWATLENKLNVIKM